MATRNVNLTERYDRFVEREIALGRFANASEVVRAALALLEQQEKHDELKLEALRRAAAEGFAELDQGKGIALADNAALQAFFEDIDTAAHAAHKR
jgi:antitoxin ParD1/3/4